MYFSTTATLVRLFCYCRVFHGSVFSNSQINMKTVSIASTFFMYACFDVCYEPRLRCPFWVTCQMVHLKHPLYSGSKPSMAFTSLSLRVAFMLSSRRLKIVNHISNHENKLRGAGDSVKGGEQEIIHP